MFEMPQEMGLIAIAVRQTQGKGQSSLVVIAVIFLSGNPPTSWLESSVCAEP